MNLYKGRFDKEIDELAKEFNSSIKLDERLYAVDIQGSLAHSKMLNKQKIISDQDFQAIDRGLKSILEDIENKKLVIDNKAEDIHMFIEEELTKRIGDAGKKLHTARSRNDQVALDIKLYSKEKIIEIIKNLFILEESFIKLAKENLESLMPGYTHLQIAQPITMGHHLMAYVQMFKRDISRFIDSLNRLNYSPLGSCALATTTYDIDRFFTSDELRFKAPTLNSLDSVSDRDHILEISFNISTLMMHLSRFCEEIIIFSSQEFGFISLDEAYSTGSSIMPQKKNPDIAELIRSKCSRVYGNLMSSLTMLKGLPLSYNKDLQEDKVYLFDSIDTCINSIKLLDKMASSMYINTNKLREMSNKGFINATDCADYLVKKGLPFRDAYTITGQIVKYCIANKFSLMELSLEDFKGFSNYFEEDVFKYLDLDYILSTRKVFGGPSKEAVEIQIDLTKKELKEYKNAILKFIE
ncbi:MAG: argininosuccinate lyase [Peptoniphilaceae bacterium]